MCIIVPNLIWSLGFGIEKSRAETSLRYASQGNMGERAFALRVAPASWLQKPLLEPTRYPKTPSKPPTPPCIFFFLLGHEPKSKWQQNCWTEKKNVEQFFLLYLCNKCIYYCFYSMSLLLKPSNDRSELNAQVAGP